jgi:hypothetical protein
MAASFYGQDNFVASLQGQIDSLRLSMPKPSTANPVGVADNSAVGTDPNKFAIEGHTHSSKARKQRVLGVTTVLYTWVYPNPFPSGTVPICNGIVEDPAASASDTYNVQVSGTPTNTQCTFRITRLSSGLLGLLAGALSFNPTMSNVNLHCTALEP